ncbi:CBO0543 family protein [Bacillus sp. CGMCC 1.16607]|uniref:CBO0543 family protein n=1 Tax=Bacillus sp. CGMCC 1.16607 TaxID=3351842 RepID=UPI00362E4E8E
MNEKLKTAMKTIENHHEIVKQDINQWLNNELFTWNWWILAAFIVIPFTIWLLVVDRKRMLEFLLVWCLVIIPTSTLDSIGIDLKFWVYPVQFIPLTPRSLPFDIFMLLYQFFWKWRPYIIALMIMALAFAFIGEPISHLLNLVYYIKWKYYYSFFYYIVLGITVKGILNKCKNIYFS